jgi:aspartyl-tRNA synthetase
LERVEIEEAKRRLGESVTISGWVSRTRDLGRLKFIMLRDASGEIQVTVKPESPIAGEVERLHLGREDVVAFRGRAVESEIVHAGVEFIPEAVKLINRAKQPVPIDISGRVKAELDTRLDYRFLDFRTPRTRAIFRIQHTLLQAFRRFLSDRGYLEIQPPCIIASASEGGAELFKLPYFEKTAYLAQSPQLYKQMCAIGFERVFMVVPVWRAEKFDTPTHLNEVRQMDIEQAYADDGDVMGVLEECLVYMLGAVRDKCREELKILGMELEVPRLPLRRLTYSEAIEMLRGIGDEIIWGEDFTRTQERKLWRLLDEEAFFIKDWPDVLKPFYAMPKEDDPRLVHAFDLIYRGLEISSGTQRIHLPDLLRKRLREKGLNPEDFRYYIECFEYGAPPHAGWSIGLERLTMAVTGVGNIRECCMFPRDRERLVP